MILWDLKLTTWHPVVWGIPGPNFSSVFVLRAPNPHRRQLTRISIWQRAIKSSVIRLKLLTFKQGFLFARLIFAFCRKCATKSECADSLTLNETCRRDTNYRNKASKYHYRKY